MTPADYLDLVARPVSAGLAAVPVVGPVLGPAVLAGLGLVADLLRAGDDPVVVITRIRRSPELLRAAEARFAAALAKHHPTPAWSEPPDTDPGPARHETQPSMPAVTEDIYAEEHDET